MDNLPPPIQVTQGNGKGGSGPKDDDSLVEVKIKNPFQKFFNWIISFIKKNQNITIKIPIIGILMALSGLGVGLGSGYNLGFNAALSKFFPNSSPLFHRAISVEGIIQKSNTNKFYLKSENNLWTLKPKSPIIPTTLNNLVDKQVTVKGNLTKEANVVEVSEIIPSDSLPLISPNLPNPSSPSNPSVLELPDLYPNLTWEKTQKKVLIFTSGKRKIEQEGIYLESAQISTFPLDFINYYLEEFKNRGFKETLNSINPEGITITYAKDDLFLTFGTKNIYSGSRDKKQLIGYKAFIEHN